MAERIAPRDLLMTFEQVQETAQRAFADLAAKPRHGDEEDRKSFEALVCAWSIALEQHRRDCTVIEDLAARLKRLEERASAEDSLAELRRAERERGAHAEAALAQYEREGRL